MKRIVIDQNIKGEFSMTQEGFTSNEELLGLLEIAKYSVIKAAEMKEIKNEKD